MRFWYFVVCICLVAFGMIACRGSQGVGNDADSGADADAEGGGDEADGDDDEDDGDKDDGDEDGGDKDDGYQNGGDEDADTQADETTHTDDGESDGAANDSDTPIPDSETNDTVDDSEQSSDATVDTADTEVATSGETVDTGSSEPVDTDTGTVTDSDFEDGTDDLPDCALGQTPGENGFVVVVSQGANLPIVGIVEWCSSVAQPDKAYIEFGQDTSYGMVAPVDLDEPNYRTVLLGMQADKPYHIRAVVESGGNLVKSADTVFQSGPVYSISPPIVEVQQPDKVAGGFIVLAVYDPGNFVQLAMGLIYDSEGKLVWGGRTINLADTTAARMSYDGTTMAVISSNNLGTQGGIELLSMDGLSSQRLQLSDAAHDLTPTMDNGFAYLAYSKGASMVPTACAKVMKTDGQGETTLIFDTADVWGDNCHGNALRYSASQGLFTVLDYEHREIVAFDEAGTVAWVTQNDGLWEYAYGHQLLENSLLVFENGGDAASDPVQSSVKEFGFTDTSGGLELIWEYTVDGLGTPVFGDVQRLPNGNTLVAYSTAGIIHEVDEDGALVKSWDFRTLPFGYVSWRPTLYGPPESLKP